MSSKQLPFDITKEEFKDFIINDLFTDKDIDTILLGLRSLHNNTVFPLEWKNLTIKNVDELQTILFKAYNHDVIVKMLNGWADRLQYNFPTHHRFSKYEIEDELHKIINTRHRQ